jgi:hypothetical protein
MQRVNFELFYKTPDDLQKEWNYCISNYPTKVITEVFDRTDSETQIIYTKENDRSYDTTNCKCYFSIVGMEEDRTEIELKEFRSKYRKFFKSRLLSNEFLIDTLKIGIDENNVKEIILKARFIRGVVKVVLVTAYIDDEIEINEGIVNLISKTLQEKLPISANGKVSNTTIAKISSVNESYYIPYKKLVPRFLNYSLCKKLTEYIDEDKRTISEFKWLRTKTGLIIVSDHDGEYRNIITNNKIHSDFILEEYVAFDSDCMDYIIGKFNKHYKNCAESCSPIYFLGSKEIANYLLSILENNSDMLERMSRKIFNDRFVSYYARRYKYISQYEKMRSAKRALANIGKDLL